MGTASFLDLHSDLFALRADAASDIESGEQLTGFARSVSVFFERGDGAAAGGGRLGNGDARVARIGKGVVGIHFPLSDLSIDFDDGLFPRKRVSGDHWNLNKEHRDGSDGSMENGALLHK